MEMSTIAGICLGVSLLVAAVVFGQAPVAVFVDYSAMLCVGGGAFCALLIGFPLSALKLLPAAIYKTLFVHPATTERMIEQIVSLAEMARRDGMLSLERRVEELPHPLLKLGMQRAIDGVKPLALNDVLQREIDLFASNQALCKAMLDQLGKYAPAFGMIGTMLGLVMMLTNMSDPSAIGQGMAVALLTTLYGAILANLFCLPLSQKLAYYHREELKVLELIAKGVLAIQSGQHPRVIEQKLTADFLSVPRTLRRAG